MDSIFTTLPRQRIPVSPEDLESPVKKEAWYREAASLETQVNHLLQLFERDQISKGEYLNRMRKIFRFTPREAPDDIIREGGKDFLGHPSEDLFFTPAFADWAIEDYRDWKSVQSKLDRDLSLKLREFGVSKRDIESISRGREYPGLPVDFFIYQPQHNPGSGWAFSFLFYTLSNVEGAYREDWKVVVPVEKTDDWEGRPAKSKEEFLQTYNEAWDVFRKVVKGYTEYLNTFKREPPGSA